MNFSGKLRRDGKRLRVSACIYVRLHIFPVRMSEYLTLSPKVGFVEVNEDEYFYILHRGKMELSGINVRADEILLRSGNNETILFVDGEKNVARIKKKKISFWRKIITRKHLLLCPRNITLL